MDLTKEELKTYREITMEYEEIRNNTDAEMLISNLRETIEDHKFSIEKLEVHYALIDKLYKGGYFRA